MRSAWMLALVCGSVLAGEARGTVMAPGEGKSGGNVVIVKGAPSEPINSYYVGLSASIVNGEFRERPTEYRFTGENGSENLGRLYLKDGVVRFDGDTKRCAALLAQALPLQAREEVEGHEWWRRGYCTAIFSGLNKASVTKAKAGVTYVGTWDKSATDLMEAAYGKVKP